ncbi:hypothetical protein GC176_01245 [bacterium]|nr:hypothetical protein [bacterium]
MSTQVMHRQSSSGLMRLLRTVFLTPLRVVLWPLLGVLRALHHHFLAYLIGQVTRDRKRVYRVRFVWYGDSIYLHPMIWGSLLLSALTAAGWMTAGWALLVWFVVLFLCYVTILYNLDVVRCAILAVSLIAFFGMAHMTTVELAWNPLTIVAAHIKHLDASVSPGFFIAAAYVFTALIAAEVVWAWLFHRVEIDESYVYEHQFLRATTREPIFARGLKRETRDILELLLLGAGDIQHRTRKGFKAFRNVPFASLWLGTAIDSLLDFRRTGELALKDGTGSDESSDVRVSDANPDLEAELADEDFDSEGNDGEADDADEMDDADGVE